MPDHPLSAYLAGPDVFAPDADARFATMRQLCADNGIAPICPTDGDLPAGLAGATLARHIKFSNIQRISPAARVIANIRLEERRVGKECVTTCSSRRSPYTQKKK